ncbi:MAG TPA: DUF924 family protein [Xanthobacteraceae bacterium]|jgi:uncharacterized protein (DUF924 family)|nr:DUF924 family protein [Xanthobacteraceae bacterium]
MTSGLGTTEAIEPADVLAFWRTAGPDKWFEKDALFDAEIARRFSALWHAVREGKLRAWGDTAEGALALVIVLDQFPRNMFRGDGRCYATDELARSVADRAIRRGFDRQLPHAERQFFYLPLMHSENFSDQQRCLELARDYGDADFMKYAEQHADIIRRFGRFPHRNAILGRPSRPDEQTFLEAGGFAG